MAGQQTRRQHPEQGLVGPSASKGRVICTLDQVSCRIWVGVVPAPIPFPPYAIP